MHDDDVTELLQVCSHCNTQLPNFEGFIEGGIWC